MRARTPAVRVMHPPAVDGVLTAAEVEATARSLVDLQLASGMIEWFPGGHTDPWNHIEAAMALATCGFVTEAEAAYRWLIDNQRDDGSWHNYYLADGVEDPKLDTNCVAYIATGILHQMLATGDDSFATEAWPTVEAAIEFVLTMQTARGEVIWARHVDHRPWDYALLTGSSSISHSLASAFALGERLGHRRPHWSEARDRLVTVIAEQPDIFEPKTRWAMDWYYPALAGAVDAETGRRQLQSRWDTFVLDGKGVLCVSDEPWVTAAETCECAMACLAVDLRDEALALFTWAQELRDTDGAYFTGIVHPDKVHFPADERSSYTAAAVILAADALQGTSPTSGLFVKHRQSR